MARNWPIVPGPAIQDLQPPANRDRTFLNDRFHPIGGRPPKVSNLATEPLEQQSCFSLGHFEDLKTYPVAAAQVSYNESLPTQE